MWIHFRDGFYVKSCCVLPDEKVETTSKRPPFQIEAVEAIIDEEDEDDNEIEPSTVLPA